MIERIWDLEIIFKKYYRDWRFGHQSSIKVVLPALVPERSYKKEVIQDGGGASISWIEMLETDDSTVHLKKADELRSYCHLDTIAMVELLNHVQEL